MTLAYMIAPTSTDLDILIAYLTQRRTEALAICQVADLAVENAPVDSAERSAAWHVAQAADASFFAAHEALLIARRAVDALASLSAP